jgi:hypothetical protein
VLALSARGRAEDRQIVLSRFAALVLEGLTLQRIGSSPTADVLVNTSSGPVRVANCRFVVKGNNAVGVWAHESPVVDVRNCVLLGSRSAVVWGNSNQGGSLSVDNCQLATSSGVTFHYGDQVQKVDLRVNRSTFVGEDVARLEVQTVPDFFTAGTRPKARRFQVEVENSVLHTDCTFCAWFSKVWRDKPVPAGPFKTLATDLIGWRDRGNLYLPKAAFIRSARPSRGYEPLLGADQVAEWRKVAGPEAGVLRGNALFVGGELNTRASSEPERVQPRHFRLQPQSPGYRAGKDGRDLGADAELVGPGEAYERWKKTPDYQKWLKETGQKK